MTDPQGSHPKTGLRRIVNAFSFSANGLRKTWKHEAAFRQEVNLLLVALVILAVFDFNNTERAILVFVSLTVLVVELLNTAVETVVDRIGPEHHKLSGRAKDMGSAAVLMSLIAAGLCWLFIGYDVLQRS